jgi:deoxyribodipyrimidine photo-lyase
MSEHIPSQGSVALVWLRRDLRLHDHAALALALRQADRIACCFVFDRDILDPLPRRDRRVVFIRETLVEIERGLKAEGGSLWVSHARPEEAIPALARKLGASIVVAAHDYEPSAIARDRAVAARLAAQDCELLTCKDQAVFECSEVLTQDGRPFSVFTPYKRAWLRALEADPIAIAEQRVELAGRLLGATSSPPNPGRGAHASNRGTQWSDRGVPSLVDLGFEAIEPDEIAITAGSDEAGRLLEDFASRIGRYREARDYPAVKGPSYLSVHMRFGTLSVRQAARLARARAAAEPTAREGAESWLSELIWRDFYFQILWHHPRVVERAFRAEYDSIAWSNNHDDFLAWCEGRTGYPLVDAAMAQINRTGYMHNRLRMIVASFLTKDLGIDWRWGERYFAERLIDFDLSANNGGWQWASSSGCDAQPYFRIFNPVTQSERFDPEGKFIRRYLPQLARLSNRDIHAPWNAPALELAAAGVALGANYPRPIVNHDQARKLTLERYSVVKNK